MIRLGHIRFLNSLPILFQAEELLQSFNAQVLLKAAPSRLNQAILDGKLDISPISTSAYCRHKDQLVLLPNLAIASYGPVDSVLLFSRQPLEQWIEKGLPAVVPVPQTSDSSIALLRGLLRMAGVQERDTRFVPYPTGEFERMLAQHGCGLTIGDEALIAHYTPRNGDVYAYDLASLWQRQTAGLPFVFAVWVARRSWLARHPGVAEALLAALSEHVVAVLQSSQRMAAVLDEAQTMMALPKPALADYLTRAIQYGWSDQHTQAVEQFGLMIDRLQADSSSGLSPAANW